MTVSCYVVKSYKYSLIRIASIPLWVVEIQAAKYDLHSFFAQSLEHIRAVVVWRIAVWVTRACECPRLGNWTLEFKLTCWNCNEKKQRLVSNKKNTVFTLLHALHQKIIHATCHTHTYFHPPTYNFMVCSLLVLFSHHTMPVIKCKISLLKSTHFPKPCGMLLHASIAINEHSLTLFKASIWTRWWDGS